MIVVKYHLSFYNFKMVSKKRLIRKPTDFIHTSVINKVLKFFNEAKNVEEIVDVIRDDPSFGKSNGAYGIRKSVANNILKARSELPENKFKEIKQIDQVYGVGPDTINDIFYHFYSNIVKTKVTDNKTPEIILDFVYENNLLYIVIENIGDSVANNVSIDFDKKILGLNKEKIISEMRIFKNISMIPPNKRFKIFVDTFSSYVKNKQPLVFVSKITYYKKQRRFDDLIKHDLTIYKDFIDIIYSKSNFA